MSTHRPTGLRERLAAFWQSTRLFFGVLSLVRFQLILLLIGIVLVLFVSQAKDLLIYYGLKCQSEFGGEVILFLATAMGCALTMWYSSRVMFRFRFVREGQRLATEPRISPSDQDVLPWLKHHLPRWLGAGVFLTLLAGLLALWDDQRFAPVSLVAWLVGSLLVFVVFVNLRRRMFGLPRYHEQKTHNNLTDWSDLPVSTRRWYWVLLLSNALVMIVAIRAPHAMASLIGPGGVLLLGAGLAVVVGSTLVYLSNWFRFPVVWVTLAMIAMFSLLNENHRVRLCPDMVSTDAPDHCVARPDTRPSARDALDAWVAARAPDVQGGKLPVVIVATEGGGIRAAYWTAAILGTFENERRADAPFHRYVLGVSGVSGGSLGASVYAALSAGRTADTRATGNEVLEQDFLGPTLVTLMFPDLLQRFLPAPIFNDRAMTLERSFEKSWQLAAGNPRFAQPLNDLYADGDDVPWLLLNSTLVESGERMVYAPVRMTDTLSAVDGVAMMGMDVPLSTAVHNSARFPYVSPAGVVQRRDNIPGDQRRHWTRLVDGGYVDNAGAQTALELLRLVQRERARLHDKYDVDLEPFVIQITNSEASPIPPCRRARTDADALGLSDNCFRRRFLPETLSPLLTMLATRPANTWAAIDRLKTAVGPNRYARFALRDNGVAHPLGWMLAAPSRRDMLHQIEGYPAGLASPERADVREEVAQVLSFLNEMLASGETP